MFVYSFFQPNHLNPGLERAIEIVHSDKPLSQADIDLIKDHSEELKDHAPTNIRPILDYMDLVCFEQMPTSDESSSSSHRLAEAKTEVTMKDLEEEKARLLKELCNQAETGATAKDLKDERLTLMIRLGRVEREIQRRRNQ